MKAIAYAIAGGACAVVAGFAPGVFATVASFWCGVMFVLLIMRNES